LEGKSGKSSPPSQDCDSWSLRPSDRPSGCDGPARPPSSYSDAGGGQSQEPSSDSTGIMVTVNVGPSMSVSPCDAATDETLRLDDWHRVHCTEETNLLRKIPASVACVVK